MKTTLVLAGRNRRDPRHKGVGMNGMLRGKGPIQRFVGWGGLAVVALPLLLVVIGQGPYAVLLLAVQTPFLIGYLAGAGGPYLLFLKVNDNPVVSGSFLGLIGLETARTTVQSSPEHFAFLGPLMMATYAYPLVALAHLYDWLRRHDAAG